jgi:hypothetical protein
MSANMNYMDTMSNTQNQQSIMTSDSLADMDNTQAQKLNFLNEKLNRASAPSVAPVITHKYGFTGGPLDKFPAKRFSNEGLSQPPRAQVEAPTWHSRPQRPVVTQKYGYTGGRPIVAKIQGYGYTKSSAFVTNMENTQTHGYVLPLNVENFYTQRFHNRRPIDQGLNQGPGAEVMMPAGPQYPVDYYQSNESLYQPFVAAVMEPYGPQRSYTVNPQKPVVKFPAAEVTETPNTQQPSDSASSDSDLKYDHEACVKMADLAIGTGDFPPAHMGPDEAVARLNSQAEQVLSILSRMDQTIHKYMPDKSIYVRYKLDKVEEKFASLRKRIVAQEVLDPREITRIELHGAYVAPVHELFFIDTEEGLKEMLRVMEAGIVVSDSSRPSEPALSVDTEGEISLLQILVHAAMKVYIVDFKKLGGLVFATSISTDQGEMSLRSIFESPSILKLMWDCRGDSAMFDRFHSVTLRCVLDVQLMDLVTRRDYKGGKSRSKKNILRDHKTVKAMDQAFHSRCTEIPLEVRQEWHNIKEFGRLAMKEGYELMQRLYDLSEGIYAVADEILRGERAAAAASGGSGSDSEGTSTSTSTSTSASASTSRSTPVEKPKDFVFPYDIRPLPQVLEKYASNDVTALPVLYDHHSKHATWNAEVEYHVWLHSEKRLRDARVPGSGERLKGNENLAPKGWFDVEWLKGLDE